MPPRKSNRPSIRVLRHLARTGGTLISKCIGCMDGVVLLSETHPAAMESDATYPLKQAVEWFGLLTPRDLKQWKRAGAVPFTTQIMLMRERAAARGESLVLRDWSHIDFVGYPFARPSGRSACVELLDQVFNVHIADTVRHPIDHWLSLSRLPIMQPGKHGPGLRIEQHLRGVRMHAELCAERSPDGLARVVRYEDFTRDPDAGVKTLCEQLELEVDEAWRTKWASYTTITGDKPGSGRGAADAEIKPLPRREHDPALVELCRRNDDYLRACELLGYDA